MSIFYFEDDEREHAALSIQNWWKKHKNNKLNKNKTIV